jgi:hypothetical protein
VLSEVMEQLTSRRSDFLATMTNFLAKELRSDVDRKIKSPFAVADAGASAPPAGRHGVLDAVGEDGERCRGPGCIHSEG